MKQELGDQETHALYCPFKNAKTAVFLVAFFCLTTFLSWKGLNKPLEHASLVELLAVALIALTVVVPWLVEFTCFGERLILVLALIGFLTMEFQGFAPSVLDKHAELVKSYKLVSALIGLFVSLIMLIQAARNSHAGPSNPRTGGTR